MSTDIAVPLPPPKETSSSSPRYSRVHDRRKRPIRGLWLSNGAFYAQVTVLDGVGAKKVRRVRLTAKTVPDAVTELHQLKHKRAEGTLVVPKRGAPFDELADLYMEHFHPPPKEKEDEPVPKPEPRFNAAWKKPGTVSTERSFINSWKRFLGKIPCNQITPAKIIEFRAEKQKEGVTGRTVNLYVTILNNVLKHGMVLGWLTHLPTNQIKPLKHTARRKRLLTQEDIEKLCQAAFEVSPTTAQEFADYIRFLAFTGTRMTEALRARWDDINWKQQQIVFGQDGNIKNGEARFVDFSPKLDAHLKDMQSRRAPDTQWLFPSPRVTKNDVAAKTFVATLRRAAEKANLDYFKGFHILRHYFISQCVMAGIDYMTIAKWVGHKDGGVLIGKVYGHLSNEHAQAQAQKLTAL